jgi:Leucine-rich repeat (LRR) protein
VESPNSCSYQVTETLQSLRLFLCHSSGDKQAVRDLCKQLRADGFNPWLDEENLLPGQDWKLEITLAVRNSDIVLVCLSRDSVNKRGFVQKEIKYALDVADEQPEGSVFLIPLKLEECKVPERLSHLQWVNLFESHGYEKLLASLKTKTGKPPTDQADAQNTYPSPKGEETNNAIKPINHSDEHHQSKFSRAKGKRGKLDFLKQNLPQLTVSRFVLLALVISVIIGAWWGYLKYQRHKTNVNEAKRFLRENNYPPELYDYQNQLKGLELSEPFNLKYIPFLNSATLEELNIKAITSTNSLDGFADSLTRCTRLRKLVLDISGSQVKELPPLPNTLTELILKTEHSRIKELSSLTNLTNLTQLTLDLDGSDVEELPPLPNTLTKLILDMGSNKGMRKLPLLPNALTELTIDLSISRVKELPPLPSTLKEITLSLSSDQVTELPPLPNTLTKLTVRLYSYPVFMLPPLPRTLKELELDFRDTQIKDLLFLTNLPNLTKLKLDLSDSQITDLSSLANLPNLTQLTVSPSKTGIRNLSQLTNLTDLTTYLYYNSSVKDLLFLTNLPNLTKLDLDLSNSEVKELSSLPNTVTELTLSLGVSQIKDLSPLTKLPYLTRLNLYFHAGARIDLKSLSNLSHLTHLNLNFSFSPIEDLPSLSNLTNLTKLTFYIGDSEIKELPLLTNLTNLTQLAVDLGRHRLEKMPPVTHLTNLTELTLDLPEISEPPSLISLTKLTRLSLGIGSNQVKELPPLTNLRNLTQLTLSLRGSQVDNLKPLLELSCQTLELNVTTEQRMSLKAIPKSLTYLKF